MQTSIYLLCQEGDALDLMRFSYFALEKCTISRGQEGDALDLMCFSYFALDSGDTIPIML